MCSFQYRRQLNQRNESLPRTSFGRGERQVVKDQMRKTDLVKFLIQKLDTLHYALGDHRVSDFDKTGDVSADHQVGGLAVLGCRA